MIFASQIAQTVLGIVALGVIWWLSKKVFSPPFTLLMTVLTLGYLAITWL